MYVESSVVLERCSVVISILTNPDKSPSPPHEEVVGPKFIRKLPSEPAPAAAAMLGTVALTAAARRAWQEDTAFCVPIAMLPQFVF